MSEQWKTIPELLAYQASDAGNIRNRATLRVLKQKKTVGGYMVINLQAKSYAVHRLVAKTWIPNTHNKPTVDHTSRIRHDNRVSNLTWATFAEQSRNRMGAGGNNNRGVYMIDKVTNHVIASYDTLKEASLAVLGHTEGYKNVSCAALGKTRSAYGFKWQYPSYTNFPGEQWHHLDQERYISNQGRVRHGPRLLKIHVDNNGYLSAFGGLTLHILVAKAFVENPNGLPIVNHKDGDKKNCAAYNLEWVTQQKNVEHAISAGLRSNVQKVALVDDVGKVRGVFESASAAGRSNNVNISSVIKCCKGQTKTCGSAKLKFRYYQDGQVVALQEKEQKPRKASTWKSVEALDKDKNVISFHRTITSAAKTYKLNSKTILAHCDGTSRHPNSKLTFRFASKRA